MMEPKFFESLTGDELTAWIRKQREALAALDEVYVSIRVDNVAPTEDMTNQSMEMRLELRIAERELAKRGFKSFGVCRNTEG